MKALKFSADVSMSEIQKEEQAKNDKAKDKAKNDKAAKTKEVPGWIMAGNLIFSLAMFIFMYKFIPLYLVTWAKGYYPVLNGRIPFNLADGLVRMLIFLLFMWVLSQMKDIRRVFQYHGAEHKVVFNFESGKPVTVENAQKFVTFHPRCGTSFLLVVMGISMVCYALLPIDGFMPRFLARIALLPFIAGISYELIRFAAKRQGTLMGLLTAPGLWLQRVTTKPPDDSQAAVAIHALEGAMALEAAQGGELVVA
jgi:uncharacterized protein YqhQ